jgi:hypothetical protein
MKSLPFFVVLMLMCQIALSQSFSDAHLRLKGTRFAIVPPTAQFKPRTTSMIGLEDEANHARITIVELDANKGEEHTIAKARKALMEKDKVMICEQNFEISGIPVSYRKVKGLQKVQSGEGAGELTEMINSEAYFVYENYHIYVFATYQLKDEETLGKAIENSVKNVVYLKNKTIDPMEKLNFTLDLKESRLKISMLQPTILSMTLSGNEDGIDEPNFTIVQMEATERNVNSFGDGNKLIDKDMSSPFFRDKKLHIFENQEFKGYEATAMHVIDDMKKMVFLAVLRGEKHVYRIQGEAYNDYEGYLTEFRKITESIREGGSF